MMICISSKPVIKQEQLLLFWKVVAGFKMLGWDNKKMVKKKKS